MTSIQNQNFTIKINKLGLSEGQALKQDNTVAEDVKEKEIKNGLTVEELNTLDTDKNGDVTYDEFRENLKKLNGNVDIAENDIINYWNAFSNEAKNIENNFEVKDIANGNYVVKMDDTKHLVRTTLNGVANTEATSYTTSVISASDGLSVLKTDAGVNTVYSEAYGVNIAGIVYGEDKTISQITVNGKTYTGSPAITKSGNTYTVKNGETVVATLTQSNGKITSVTQFDATKNTYSTVNLKTSTKKEEDGKPQNVQTGSYSVGDDGKITKTQLSEKNTQNNNLKLNSKPSSEAISLFNADSETSILNNLTKVFQGYLGSSTGVSDDTLKTIFAELSSKFKNGSVNVNKFISELKAAYPDNADLKDETKFNAISQALKDIAVNNTLDLNDIGKAVVAYAILDAGTTESGENTALTASNLKALAQKIGSTSSNFGNIASYVKTLNSNIDTEKVIDILRGAEYSENNAGNWTMNTGELKFIAENALKKSAGSTRANTTSIDSSSADKKIDNVEHKFSTLFDLYTPKKDADNKPYAKLSSSDMNLVFATLSQKFLQSETTGIIKISEIDNYVDTALSSLSEDKRKTVKAMLHNFAKQAINSQGNINDSQLTTRDFNRGIIAVATLEATGKPSNVSYENAQKITGILSRYGTNDSAAAKEILKLDFAYSLSETDVKNLIVAGKTLNDGSVSGTHLDAGLDRIKNSGSGKILLENSQSSFSKILDILDNDTKSNLSTTIKNNFIKELYTSLNKGEITDTTNWLNNFCSAYNITSEADKTKLENIISKLQTSETKSNKKLSAEDIGRYVTAYTLLSDKASISADDLTKTTQKLYSTRGKADYTTFINFMQNTMKSTYDANTLTAILNASELQSSETNNGKLEAKELYNVGMNTLSQLFSGKAKSTTNKAADGSSTTVDMNGNLTGASAKINGTKYSADIEYKNGSVNSVTVNGTKYTNITNKNGTITVKDNDGKTVAVITQKSVAFYKDGNKQGSLELSNDNKPDSIYTIDQTTKKPLTRTYCNEDRIRTYTYSGNKTASSVDTKKDGTKLSEQTYVTVKGNNEWATRTIYAADGTTVASNIEYSYDSKTGKQTKVVTKDADNNITNVDYKDSKGNPVTSEAYEYAPDNKLIRVTMANETTISFTADGKPDKYTPKDGTETAIKNSTDMKAGDTIKLNGSDITIETIAFDVAGSKVTINGKQYPLIQSELNDLFYLNGEMPISIHIFVDSLTNIVANDSLQITDDINDTDDSSNIKYNNGQITFSEGTTKVKGSELLAAIQNDASLNIPSGAIDSTKEYTASEAQKIIEMCTILNSNTKETGYSIATEFMNFIKTGEGTFNFAKGVTTYAEYFDRLKAVADAIVNLYGNLDGNIDKDEFQTAFLNAVGMSGSNIDKFFIDVTGTKGVLDSEVIQSLLYLWDVKNFENINAYEADMDGVIDIRHVDDYFVDAYKFNRAK